jgi:uncharacterized protein YqjF (DUF2071 family)
MWKHPFPVVAHFDRVIALSFAFPEKVLSKLVPEGLALDCYEGQGFCTLAMVWTSRLRPAFFPKVMGQDFFLSGLRLFVSVTNEKGRRLRGLLILRSDTEKWSMVVLGNLITDYHYHRVSLEQQERDGVGKVCTRDLNGEIATEVEYDLRGKASLPSGSPFPNERTARLFAGPMPFTFSSLGSGRFRVIEGRRQHWKPRAITVGAWSVRLFNSHPFSQATPVLANAFTVKGIDYRWESGRIEKPQGRS